MKNKGVPDFIPFKLIVDEIIKPSTGKGEDAIICCHIEQKGLDFTGLKESDVLIRGNLIDFSFMGSSVRIMHVDDSVPQKITIRPVRSKTDLRDRIDIGSYYQLLHIKWNTEDTL